MQNYEHSLKSVTNGGTLIIYLDGDIDHHNAKGVRQRIDDKLFVERPREFLLDLSRVSFMDSSGLGLLLGRYTKSRELGISFKVVNPTAQIQKILDLAGMGRMIPIENTAPPKTRK